MDNFFLKDEPIHLLASALIQNQKDFVDQLKQVRIQKGISIEEIARKVGAEVEIIEAIEDGSWDMSMTEVRHMAIALEVEVVYSVSTPDNLEKE